MNRMPLKTHPHFLFHQPVISAAVLVCALALILSVSGCGSPGGESSAENSAAGPAPESRQAGNGVVAAGERLAASDVTTRPKLVERLLIYGVDGATWRLMHPLIRAGKLPTFQRLIENGVWAPLATIEPTVSPAIWTTIATGVLPRRHGILGFDGVPGHTMTTLPNSRMRRVKAYWNILADFGRTSSTLGWWASWPVDDLGEGSCMISDRVPYTRMEAAIKRESLSPNDIHPSNLLEELVPLVERPNDIDPAVVEEFLHLDAEQMEQLLLKTDYRMGAYLPEFKYVYQSDRSTLNMAVKILKERPADAAAVYFTGVDTVSHLYWHFTFPREFPKYQISQQDIDRFGKVIPRYYELMDTYLALLLEMMGEGTTVMVVSDHGFGSTGNLPWSGGHGKITPGAPVAPPGVLILSGPGIATGGTALKKTGVLDVAPTILHLMGLPAAADMRGRVLTEAMAPGSPPELPRVASHELVGKPWVSGEAPADTAGDAERMERLRQLGYIE